MQDFHFGSSTGLDESAFLLVSLLHETVRSFQITSELFAPVPEAARLTLREDYAKALGTRQRTAPASAKPKFELLTCRESISTIPFTEADTSRLRESDINVYLNFYSISRSREAKK